MIPLRALPATTGGNANANKTNAAALSKGNNKTKSSSAASAARRAAVLLLASPAVVEHGGEDLLLAVARLLRGVAARGRDLGGGSAEWAYDLLLPDSAKTTSASAMAATGKVDDGDNTDAEKQRRASSCSAAASSSGRVVAEAWKVASGAFLRWNASGERATRKTHSLFLSFFFFSFLPSFHLSPTAPTFFEIELLLLSRSLSAHRSPSSPPLSLCSPLALPVSNSNHFAADPKRRRPGCGVAGRVSGTSFAAFAELAALSSDAAKRAKCLGGGEEATLGGGESTSFASVAAALSTSIAMLARPQGPSSRSLAFVKDENRNPNQQQQQQQPREAIEQLGSRAAIAPHSVAVVLAPLPRSASTSSSSAEALAAEARTAAAELTGSVPPHCRVVWLDCSSMLLPPPPRGEGAEGDEGKNFSSSSPPPHLAALDAALRELSLIHI